MELSNGSSLKDELQEGSQQENQKKSQRSSKRSKKHSQKSERIEEEKVEERKDEMIPLRQISPSIKSSSKRGEISPVEGVARLKVEEKAKRDPDEVKYDSGDLVSPKESSQ